MTNSINTDDVIFNFFKHICDEKDDQRCLKLGSNWVNAMETNLSNMKANLSETDKHKYEEDIKSNLEHLNNLKIKSSFEWREYATQCMIEIMENKK